MKPYRVATLTVQYFEYYVQCNGQFSTELYANLLLEK
jgi:hypothetical protein